MSAPSTEVSLPQTKDVGTYKLYKRRFAGLLGISILNLVSSMALPWFGPIANSTAQQFNISLDRVNWLGNITACTYVPAAALTPWLVSRYGMRRTCEFGSICLLLAAWIRYAGTASSLTGNRAYALLIIGQFFASIPQAIFQVVPAKYSELWFSLQGRTTATMIMAIMNPIGGAVAQVIAPLTNGPKKSILVLGIIETAVVPAVFLIWSRPPTPPTYAAAQERSHRALLKELVGLQSGDESEYGRMSTREKADFWISVMVFGVQAGAVNAFSILSSQYFAPYGYSDDISGFIGATLLLAGIIASAVSSPIFDRVLTGHLGLTIKVLIPVLSAAWISLIWAVRPNDTAALFAISALIGICGISLLPVSLELGAELTRAPDASSAFLWSSCYIFTVVMIISESALRAGSDASPPLHMHKALIFHAVIICALSLPVIGLKGKQNRRERDELEAKRVGGVQTVPESPSLCDGSEEKKV